MIQGKNIDADGHIHTILCMIIKYWVFTGTTRFHDTISRHDFTFEFHDTILHTDQLGESSLRPNLPAKPKDYIAWLWLIGFSLLLTIPLWCIFENCPSSLYLSFIGICDRWKITHVKDFVMFVIPWNSMNKCGKEKLHTTYNIQHTTYKSTYDLAHFSAL
jgi:hypothetical protein